MSDLPSPASVDRGALLGEAYRRGILPPEQRGLYEEGLRRGLFRPPAAPAGAAAPAETDVMAPESPGAPSAPAVPDAANPLGAMGSAITRAPGELRRQQESFTARAKAAEEADRLKQGYEPGVDYASGTTFGDRIQMTRMDNPAEQRAMLEGRYGTGNVFQDKGGRFYVQTPAGPKVAPTGEGMATNLLASIYGQAPQIAGGAWGAAKGAAAGAAQGARAGGVGAGVGAVAGGLAGSGLGTMLGKAADEFIKGMWGQGRKTPGEMAGALGQAGIEGALGEGAGRIVTQIPGAVGRFYRNRVAGVTPEGVSLAQSTTEAGGAAPARSLMPGLKSMAQSHDLSRRLGSDFFEERNRGAVNTRLQQVIEGAGKSPDQVRSEMAEILDPTARVSAQDAGAPIVGAVRQHAAQLEGDVANLARDADRMLTGQMGRLNALARRRPAGDLGNDVATGLAGARSEFSQKMQEMYAKVDELIAPAEQAQMTNVARSTADRAAFNDPMGVIPPGVYEQPAQQVPGVVPTGLMKKRAAAILDELPKDAQGNPIFGDARVLRSLQQMTAAPEKWQLGEAQRARSTLGEFSAFTDMTPGVAKRQFDDLRAAVDQGIGAAAMDPAAAPAIKALRAADEAYSQGIRKFEDAQINRMVTRARSGIMPDPGQVAGLVLRPGEMHRAATIKRMVEPELWQRVAAADWENNIIGPATDKVTGEVSARSLARAVEARDRGGMLELTYGPAIARDIRLYSKRMDVRGGKVPADNLAPDNFGQTMRQFEIAQREQDAFLRTNYLSELADPKRPRHDSAVNFILQPGEESRLALAQTHFGNTSPQMAGIRDQARKELLNSAIKPTETMGTTVSGTGIEEGLKQFTPRQQEILFQGQAEDMKRLAQEIKFLFPTGRPEGMMGGMIAGGINAIPIPFRWWVAAPFVANSWIFSRPTVIRALSEGLKPGPGQAATRETIRMIFRAAAAGQLDDDQPAAEPISEQITGARHARH